MVNLTALAAATGLLLVDYQNNVLDSSFGSAVNNNPWSLVPSATSPGTFNFQSLLGSTFLSYSNVASGGPSRFAQATLHSSLPANFILQQFSDTSLMHVTYEFFHGAPGQFWKTAVADGGNCEKTLGEWFEPSLMLWYIPTSGHTMIQRSSMKANWSGRYKMGGHRSLRSKSGSCIVCATSKTLSGSVMELFEYRSIWCFFEKCGIKSATPAEVIHLHVKVPFTMQRKMIQVPNWYSNELRTMRDVTFS
ncbi:hypothetical protein C8R45DRAFT_945657 [Mycena sanguinolenta]|nr:hypothetical protein C8R45DRAFT_945657 [Mycena sanguinolenta]